MEAWIFGGFSADDDDREIVEGVGVAFPKLVDPDDGSVIKHVTRLPGFGCLLKLISKVGKLLGEPDVDLFELILRVLVFVGLVA